MKKLSFVIPVNRNEGSLTETQIYDELRGRPSYIIQQRVQNGTPLNRTPSVE